MSNLAWAHDSHGTLPPPPIHPSPVATSHPELRKLAFFGGNRLFQADRHVGRPSLLAPQAILANVAKMLDSHWLSNQGPLVRTFEDRIAQLLEVPYCIATNNATSALQLLIRALGIASEVVVPSFTFVATAHAVATSGARPVFADCLRNNGNIDAADVARKITDKTEAILAVDLFGAPADADALTRLARKHKIPLLFDSSHAFACSHRGEWLGTRGLAGVYSFHATKFLCAGEGGAIVTRDRGLAETLRQLRNFGFHNGQVSQLGINAKMPEASAAIGLANLEVLPELLSLHVENRCRYGTAFEGIPGLKLWHDDSPADQQNHQYIVLEVDECVFGLSSAVLHGLLHAEGVLAKRYFHPGCHRMTPYADEAHRCPTTDELIARVLVLPTGQGMSPSDIHRVGQLFQFFYFHAATIADAIAALPSRAMSAVASQERD